MKNITPSEMKVLNVLWSLDSASVQQVREAYNAKYRGDLAHNTVMTMLVRLVAKKAISVNKKTDPFHYRAVLKKPSLARKKLSELIQSMFGGSAEELVSHLIETEELSKSDLTRIEAIIESRKNAL